MEYKLEFNPDQPKSNYIRLLSDPFYGVLILLADIKLTTDEFGDVDKNSKIADFIYRVQEDGVAVDELLIPDLTNSVSEILCNLFNTSMA